MGLPSGVNDFQFEFSVGFLQNATLQRQFMVRCAFVAGKIMDRCTQNGTPFSVGISRGEDLEAEMNVIAANMPLEWWNLPVTLPGPGSELDELRARLLQQAFYFQVRMHIDLSHLGEAPGSPHWQSKLKCMEAARQLLRRAVLLSSRLEEWRLFECKTNDFIGFIAASILTIGLFTLGNDVDQRVVSNDQYLIDTMRNNFHKEEILRRCQIARQCGRTLELLNNPREAPDSLSGKIIIPYFGTVVRKGQLQSPFEAANSISGISTPQSTNRTAPYQQSNNTDTMGIDGQPAPDLFSDNLYWELENSGGFFTGDFNPMLDPAMVDLSQDWSLFSNLDGTTGL